MKKKSIEGTLLIDAIMAMMMMSLLSYVLLGYAKVLIHYDQWEYQESDIEIWSGFERCEIYCPDVEGEDILSLN